MEVVIARDHGGRTMGPAGGHATMRAVQHYQIDSLRARRAARELELRRRRRRRGAVLALTLAALALAGSLVTSWSGHSRHPHLLVASAGASPATASRPPGSVAGLARSADQKATPASESPAQLAAVRRLVGLGEPLFCGGHQRRMVALTFDDGPGVYTKLAIRKLRSYHLVATFFLVGKEIRAWPGLAQREKPFAAFGDHTMTHPFLPALPQAEMVREIAGAQALIEQTTGQPVVLFRPPYEGRTPAIDREARALGMLEVLWSIDSQDSLGADYAGIEHNVIAGLRPGSIILMHENHGQTIRALPRIFAALARDRLTAVTVPELVAEDPPSLLQLRSPGGGCGSQSPQIGTGS